MSISTDVLNSVNGTSSVAGKSGNSAQEVQDRFLKLLVAQLNNQDPMNPLDNAQMTSQIAQLNTVTGIEQLNQTVSSVLSQMASMQALQGASMVGRDVLVDGSQLSVVDGVGQGAFELATPAENVMVEIRTATGALVERIELGAQPAGRGSFEWDATRYTGSEQLHFSIAASANQLPVSATALARARVDGISTENNQLMLHLAGQAAPVAYGSVKAIF